MVNLYKFEEERYGQSVVRYLSFKNDEDHQLGETPIPGGQLKVYRTVDDDRHLVGPVDDRGLEGGIGDVGHVCSNEDGSIDIPG